MLVVKVGGGPEVDWEAVSSDLAARWRREPLVLLHGASKELDRISTLLGHPPVTVRSASGIQSRFTDDATLDIFTMVYAGGANVRVVERLQARGVPALGLSGIDGALLRGPEKGTLRSRDPDGRVRVLRGDRSGRVEEVNAGLLSLLLGAGYLPVVCPPALSQRGRAMNVDGDRAAARVAAAVGADTLVLLTDVPGLLRDRDQPSTLVREVRPEEIDLAMAAARGRMRVKVLAAREALEGGVARVVIGDARVPRPISHACQGLGTVFCSASVARARE